MTGCSGSTRFYTSSPSGMQPFAPSGAQPVGANFSPTASPLQEATASREQVRAPSCPAYTPHFTGSDGTVAPFQPTSGLAELLDGIPPAVRSEFTYNHLAALEVALVKSRPVPRKHKLDFRVSLPFFGKRYYFVLLGGAERRSILRIERDGQNAPWRLTAAYFVIVTLLASVGLTALILGLYALKSLMGIDMFEGSSFMHGIVFTQ